MSPGDPGANTRLLATLLALLAVVAFIAPSLHVEGQGYCDSNDDYLVFLGASSYTTQGGITTTSSNGSAPALLHLTVDGERRTTSYGTVPLPEDRVPVDGFGLLISRPG